MSNIDCLLDVDPGLLMVSVNDKLTTINRNINAGNGLTGGGQLNDSDITINAVTPATIDLTTVDNASLHTHKITTSSDPSNAAAILSTDIAGLLTLHNMTVTSDLVSEGDFTSNYALFLESVDFSDNLRSVPYSAQATGWGITNYGDADFRNIFADNMNVGTFITDNILATAGTEILTKSLGILAEDFVVANTVNFIVFDLSGTPNTPVFSDGDTIMVRRIERNGGLIVEDIIGTVNGYVDLIDGKQQWTLSKTDGTNGKTVFKGSTVLDFGVSGDGFILSTALGVDPPYIDIRKWVTTIDNDTTYSKYGYLNGITGVEEYGLYSGISATQQIVASDQRIELKGAALSLYDGTTEVVKIDPTTLSIALGNPLPSFGDAGIWFGKDGAAYKARIGSATDYFLWDGSLLTVAGKLLVDDDSRFEGVVTIGSSGGIWQGTGSFASPARGLKIWNDGGYGRIAGYSDSYLQAEFDTEGKIVAGAGSVVLDFNGITLRTVGTLVPFPADSIKWVGGPGFSHEAATLGAVIDAFGNAQFIIEAKDDAGIDKSRITLEASDGGSYTSIRLHSQYLTIDGETTLNSNLTSNYNISAASVNTTGNIISTGNVSASSLSTTGNVSATGSISASSLSATGNIISSQDIRAASGIVAGNTTTNAGTGVIIATSDVRAAGGIVSGSTTLNPSTGVLMYTGALTARRSSISYTGYIYVPKSGQSYAYNNASLNANTTYTISYTSMGIPSAAKAVQIAWSVNATTAGQNRVRLGYSSGDPNDIDMEFSHQNYQRNSGISRVNNGNVYFRSNKDLVSVYMWVSGYWI